MKRAFKRLIQFRPEFFMRDLRHSTIYILLITFITIGSKNWFEKNLSFFIKISSKNYLIKNLRFNQFSWKIAQSDHYNLRIDSRQKIWVWGQITNLGSFWVKFQNLIKVCKSYIKMKLLAPAFHKSWFQGHTRSPEVKNRQKIFIYESQNKTTKIFCEVSKIFQLSRFVIWCKISFYS